MNKPTIRKCHKILLDQEQQVTGRREFIPWPNEKQDALPGFETVTDGRERRDCPLFGGEDERTN